MELKDIVTISGMGGLHKKIAERPNGMVVCPLGEKQNKFVPSRKHNFTQLDNITIYTQEDTKPLDEVLDAMYKATKTTPLIDVKAKPDELRAYFEKIVKDYDPEKVYVSDIQKVIKWYMQLDAHKYFETKAKKTTKDSKEGTKKAEAKKAPAKANVKKNSAAKPKISAKATAKKKPATTMKASGRKA